MYIFISPRYDFMTGIYTCTHLPLLSMPVACHVPCNTLCTVGNNAHARRYKRLTDITIYHMTEQFAGTCCACYRMPRCIAAAKRVHASTGDVRQPHFARHFNTPLHTFFFNAQTFNQQ